VKGFRGVMFSLCDLVMLFYFIFICLSPLTSVFIYHNRFINTSFSISWSNKVFAKVIANFVPAFYDVRQETEQTSRAKSVVRL
jgi:hypothetical protein